MDYINIDDLKVEPEWREVRFYDIRTYHEGYKTDTYSSDEVLTIKETVLKKLISDGIERFNPKILLFDNGDIGKKEPIIVYVIFGNKNNDNIPRNRIIHINKNIVTREIVTK